MDENACKKCTMCVTLLAVHCHRVDDLTFTGCLARLVCRVGFHAIALRPDLGPDKGKQGGSLSDLFL